jgi:phytoene desaturase
VNKRIAIIGAGFSGLSAACELAYKGYDVTIFDKLDSVGGRARKFASEGFTFDIGPTWYWMPDVFDNFFNKYGHNRKDYYGLKRIDPGYSIFFGKDDSISIPENLEELYSLFESIEVGAGAKLKSFIKESKVKYDIGINELVYNPGLSLLELLNPSLILKASKLHVFQSIRKYVANHFKNKKLKQILEFPVLFLGATPDKIPALYSLMNYADLVLGTWYPEGGMSAIPESMARLAENLGTKIKLNSNVSEIIIKDNAVNGLTVNGKTLHFDGIIGSADYNHIEQQLLPKKYRNYTSKYWESRTMSPSALIFYLGINKKLAKLGHHVLFCDEDMDEFSHEIYSNSKWPSKPLFYTCCSSKSDPTTAPLGHENLYILMPIAPGIEDTEEIREKYLNLILNRIEHVAGEKVKGHVIYQRSYALNDFTEDYNAFKGNAYGLANTLMQTANLKPKIKNKKVKNLYYSGQLTVPGPGIPPSIISGNVVAIELMKTLKL